MCSIQNLIEEVTARICEYQGIQWPDIKFGGVVSNPTVYGEADGDEVYLQGDLLSYVPHMSAASFFNRAEAEGFTHGEKLLIGTIAHEICHCITWQNNGLLNHGNIFKRWAKHASKVLGVEVL